MERKEQLYEGKAKKVYATDDPQLIIVEYTDGAAAFHGRKKGTIAGKGSINNRVSNDLMRLLEKQGIPTHLVEQLSDRETVIRKAQMIPLKVIVRNVVAGSLSTRIGMPEGTRLKSPVLEYNYKDDALGDPMINRFHALALDLCAPEELATIERYAFRANDILRTRLQQLDIDLIDFKLEFGRLADGTIVLADEISPDTCRFWDTETGERLDMDRFRRDMGGAEDAYQEVLHRLLEE
ncbi:MAG: phosphoribosylaminoimidazolesuccinocarboxamide synthase [Eubacteriales bacterium]|nr:phosphoribosylaminoimidazolesuccinocarboxamide synthase [Eubacteriales bacterium]